jgi:hypothetical protein
MRPPGNAKRRRGGIGQAAASGSGKDLAIESSASPDRGQVVSLRDYRTARASGVGCDLRAADVPGSRRRAMVPLVREAPMSAYGTGTIKRRRRTKGEVEQLERQILDVLEEDHPESIRHVFYRMTNPIDHVIAARKRAKLERKAK